MKSALDLAMEKANKISGGEVKKLNDSQKENIAEIRRVAEAKIAERKIYLDENMAKLPDGPEAMTARDQLQNEFNDERAKIEERMEADIEKVKID